MELPDDRLFTKGEIVISFSFESESTGKVRIVR
jgi:hypothetical protein